MKFRYAHVVPADLSELAARLRRATRITVLTGAGVSAASGIPTFRGAGGLWKQVRAETLASADGFAADPALVWEWYDWRRQLIRAAEPNAAHHALARWTNTRVITQNVDGLHERAGTTQLVRLHGSIWRLRCWAGCQAGSDGWDDEQVPLDPRPPRCPHCGALARPGVVWFGEALDPEVIDAALSACRCDVFLSIGTSAIVYPAAGLVHEARSRGAFTVEINPEVTGASDAVDLAVAENAEDVLPRLTTMIERA